MKKTIRLYIGADNASGLVNEGAVNYYLLSKDVKGFTLIKSVGYWEGRFENSIAVEFTDSFHNEATLIDFTEGICKDLKRILKQEAVGYMILPAIIFI